MKMNWQLKFILLSNILVGLLFVLSNINFLNILNSAVSSFTPSYVSINDVSIGPLHIAISQLILSNGDINLGPRSSSVPNYPFILYWVALAGNFYFIFRMQRSKETKTELNGWRTHLEQLGFVLKLKTLRYILNLLFDLAIFLFSNL